MLDRKTGHVISSSPNGSSYDYLGCFPLGTSISRKSFIDVVRSQQRLKEMKLLDEIKYMQLNQIGQNLQQFCSALGVQNLRYMSDWLAAMQELAQQLSNIAADNINPIRAHIG